MCMKMNKRMQAMEAKGKDLVKKRGTLLMERQKLLDLFRTVIPVPVLSKEDNDLELDVIEKSWAEFDTKRRDQVTDLEQKLIEKEQLMQKSLHAMEEQYKQIIADLRTTQPTLTSESSTPGDAATSEEASELERSEQQAATEATQKRSIEAIIEAEKEKMVSFDRHLLQDHVTIINAPLLSSFTLSLLRRL